MKTERVCGNYNIIIYICSTYHPLQTCYYSVYFHMLSLGAGSTALM